MLLATLGLLIATNVSAMTVTTATYGIGPKVIGNWAGSYLHSATAYPGPSDLDLDGIGGKDTLYMGGFAQEITGIITGDWNGTILSNITGMIDGMSVLGGSLGGAYYGGTIANPTPLWSLTVATKGTFYFESLPINRIDENRLTLWGQNSAAYSGPCVYSDTSDSDGACDMGWGIDLYGQRITNLTEPSTANLILLAWFLSMAITFVTRYRAKRICESTQESESRIGR